ncbi:MAG: hypothetical protein E8D44_02025 [Nitrospira sp.]|nr:MAG: hypothetical protein E8D44_02025 [Nitrospira sp.]
MQVHPSESSVSSSRTPRPPERAALMIVMALVLLYVLWTLRIPQAPSAGPVVSKNAGPTSLAAEMIPLVSGDEPIVEIFTKAGCPVCHTIPGIPGANGQVGPPLTLGVTGAQRLADPAYQGRASNVHEYVVESVVDPSVFVVPGYPERTMPVWYGAKLSALALEKIAEYLEHQTGNALVR